LVKSLSSLDIRKQVNGSTQSYLGGAKGCKSILPSDYQEKDLVVFSKGVMTWFQQISLCQILLTIFLNMKEAIQGEMVLTLVSTVAKKAIGKRIALS